MPLGSRTSLQVRFLCSDQLSVVLMSYYANQIR